MIYDQKTIASIKFRSTSYLRKLSRNELLTRLQLIRNLEPIVVAAYREVEDKRWRNQEGDSPHGEPWHVSFHASQFPGDNPTACPRQALYRMMDLPSETPFTRESRTVMSAGKAIELDLVQTFEEAGLLLSASPGDEIQTGFEFSEAWLTGSVDCVILPPRWNRPLPIEIKTKYQEVIDQMRMGLKGPDDNHVFQLKVQLALIYLRQKELWPGLDPVTHGYIYYLSRDRPSSTAEFRVDLDMRFFEVGVERLKQWKQYFIDENLVEENPGKRTTKFGHPMGWKWSRLPCMWCPFRKTCQLDFRQNIQRLNESVGIERAKLVRPHYDYRVARRRVFDRWGYRGK